MKKTVKILAFVLCAVMLVVGSVFGTYAYLTAQTGPITNTFTVGNVAITLDEAKVDLYGEKVGDTRVTDKNDYKLIPGHTYVKDPTITVSAGSEECWVFIKVVNGLAGVEVKAADGDTIAEQMSANWDVITTEGATTVYAYKTTLKADEKAVAFTEFTVAGDVEAADLANADIVVTGYAVQADGFDTAAKAWAAAGFAA